MYEKIKLEVGNAIRMIGLLSVSGDAVDAVAAARQALRNIVTICNAMEQPKDDAPDEAKGAGKDETA